MASQINGGATLHARADPEKLCHPERSRGVRVYLDAGPLNPTLAKQRVPHLSALCAEVGNKNRDQPTASTSEIR